MDFDGESGRGNRVNLGGRGRNRSRGGGTESRSDFVKRQHREREAREHKRLQDKAATFIQAFFRGHRARKVERALRRQLFDKRHADISKVLPALPPEQKAKFLFRALQSMLPLFGFFFMRGEDASRLAVMLDWVLHSAGQPAACNIFQLALACDEAQRRSFLALFEKFLAATLSGGHANEAARVMLYMQSALFSGPPDYRPVDPQKSDMAVAHLLLRTEAIAVFSREVLPQSIRNRCEASEPQGAAELVLVCCSGLAFCSVLTVRHQALMCLLSAPRLGDFLLQASQGSPLPHECLLRIASLIVASSPNFLGPAQAPALHKLLGEEIEGGKPRRAWLLDNLLTLLEGFVLQGGLPVAAGSGLPLREWLTWICEIKEQRPESESSSFAGELERLHRPTFARALLNAAATRCASARDATLMAVCRLYFTPQNGANPGDSSEPPPEVLQTLAFATPLAEVLFPTLDGLMRNPSAEAVFQMLGPPALGAPEATRLRVFCSVYALQLQPMYDAEFFGPANPLKAEEVELLALFLNRLAYHIVTSFPDPAPLTPALRALRSSVTSLTRVLYNRHRRRPILRGGRDEAWIIPESRLHLRRNPVVDLGEDEAQAVRSAASDDEADGASDDEMDGSGLAATGATGRAESGGARGHGAAGAVGGGCAASEQILEAVLEEIPHVLPFKDRVALLHNVILQDQNKRRDTRGPWAQAAMQRHQIRRNWLVDDGFAAFESLSNDSLRDVFRVEFIAPNGEPESGVDGGGLFKEFMVTICRTMFDPEFGLFSSTTGDYTLYPAIGAFRTHGRRTAELYVFLGKVVGKAIYEMFLLEPQFCRVFLNRCLNRANEVDDVAALDRELHRNMVRIKEADNVEDLHLFFSISVADRGEVEEVDLIPNGRNVPVTKDNLTRYLHHMANYKMNIQFQRHTDAFLQGVQCVVPRAWLKMFDPYELNLLISGSTAGFDVADLRRNTVYMGGFQDDSPVVQWLWQLLQHMEPEDMGRFLMFATSCSRAPLLGFQNLYPKFCIHRVPDSERLPTASTCANLLKLPDYLSPEALKTKILQAIRAEAGFDLS